MGMALVNVLYTFLGFVGIMLAMLLVRVVFHWISGVYGKADRYWSMEWEKPDVPKVPRENITEICHRLRIPPPGRF